jgi:hypothetical protein
MSARNGVMSRKQGRAKIIYENEMPSPKRLRKWTQTVNVSTKHVTLFG